jgi:DNA-binding protein HU-beta
MNLTELTDDIAQRTHKSKKDVTESVHATLEAISNALSRGEEVRLIGFGTFRAKQKAEKQGRNPKTGETITIAASTKASFKPGKRLIENLNK